MRAVSLRLKMLISIVVTMLFLLAILLTGSVLESSRRLRDEREERRAWTRSLAESWLSGRPLALEDGSVDAALRPLVEAGAVAGYVVFDGRGEVQLAHPVRSGQLRVEEYRSRLAGSGDGAYYARPVSLAGAASGVLVVSIDVPTGSSRTSLRFVLAMFWTMVIGTALLVFILFILFNRFLLRPLGGLLDASRRIAVGDYSPRILPHERTDEMGQLTTAFSFMLDEVRSFQVEQESRIAEATERIRKAERSLVVAQRLAATGTLAAGIAHEINNPIGGMLNAAYWIANKGDDDPARRKQYAELIVQGLGRVQETVKKVLQFSPRHIERRRTALPPVVERARALVEHRLVEGGIAVEADFPPAFPELVIDPLEIQQVFLNLLLNAADATGRGGHVRVRGEVGRSEVVLRVEDDGVGMTPEDAARAMDLFFTTKEAGRGTGLGLSIVHNIVHNHGGNIEIDSEPGRGTTIRITLPLPAAPEGPETGHRVT